MSGSGVMASLLPMTGPPGRSGWSSSSASTTSVRWFESSDTRSSDTRGAQEFRHPRSPRVQTPAIPKGLPDTHRLRLGCQTPTVSHRLGCQTPTVWRGGILIAANHSEFGGVWVSGTPRQSLGVWVSGTPGVWGSLGVWNPRSLGVWNPGVWNPLRSPTRDWPICLLAADASATNDLRTSRASPPVPATLDGAFIMCDGNAR
jgi:hypothetical protein